MLGTMTRKAIISKKNLEELNHDIGWQSVCIYLHNRAYSIIPLLKRILPPLFTRGI